MLKSKIISITVVSILGFGSILSAQDDVSIMDLKETVYYLMIDVKKMKENEEKALKEVRILSSQNNAVINSLSNEVKKLQVENKKLREKEVLKNYKVSSELNNFNKNIK